MLSWKFYVVICIVIILLFEIICYTLFLIIKALKIYIRKNSGINDIANDKVKQSSSKNILKKFIVCNIIMFFLIFAASYGHSMLHTYNSENVIYCLSQDDVKELIKLLEENGMDYKAFNNSTKIKLLNKNDLSKAIRILQDNSISFNYVTDAD